MLRTRSAIGLLGLCLILVLSGSAVTATPTPWNRQITVAMDAAAKVDPNAVLIYLGAFPVNKATPTQAMDTYLVFARPSGDLFDITFIDARIDQTLTVESETGYIKALRNQNLAAIRDRLAFVKISAAEALEYAIAADPDFAAKVRSRVFVSVGMEFMLTTEMEAVFGIPVVWHVRCIEPPIQQTVLWVHPQTGAILARTDGRLPPAQTPRTSAGQASALAK